MELCLGKLDLIDNMLSSLETSNNPGYHERRIQLYSTFDFPSDLDQANDSPRPTAQLKKHTIQKIDQIEPSTLLRLKRSKSLRSVSPSECSTPKLVLNKEFEFLDLLYKDGSLNDSQIDTGLNHESKDKKLMYHLKINNNYIEK